MLQADPAATSAADIFIKDIGIALDAARKTTARLVL